MDFGGVDGFGAATEEELRAEIARLREALFCTNERVGKALVEAESRRAKAAESRMLRDVERPALEATVQELEEDNRRLQKEANATWFVARRMQAAWRLKRERHEAEIIEVQDMKRRLEQDCTRLRKEASASKARLLGRRLQVAAPPRAGPPLAGRHLEPESSEGVGEGCSSTTSACATETQSRSRSSDADTQASTEPGGGSASAPGPPLSMAPWPTRAGKSNALLACGSHPGGLEASWSGRATTAIDGDCAVPGEHAIEALADHADYSDLTFLDLLGEAEFRMQQQMVDLATRLERVRALRLAAGDGSAAAEAGPRGGGEKAPCKEAVRRCFGSPSSLAATEDEPEPPQSPQEVKVDLPQMPLDKA